MDWLVEGKTYTIFEPGLNNWLEDYLYIGYNNFKDEHIFRSTEQFNNNFFIYIKHLYVKDDVLELSIKEQRNRKLDKILTNEKY